MTTLTARGAFLPYGRQSVDEADIAAVAAVLRGERLTTGPAVEAFESDLSAVAGGVDVVTVSSGTAALHAAYAVAGVTRGSEVVTTPLTFAATATTALQLGARVRFADVDDATLTIDPAAAEAALGPAVRVVTGVDYAGNPADWTELRAIADAYGVLLVDDAAHAIGSRLHGRPVGALADLTTFSFHPVKTVTTAEGGAVATTRPDFAAALRAFRSHGMVRDPARLRRPDEGPWHQEVHSVGLNYRMPDVLAALGRSQLRRLDRFVARRAALVARYDELLADVDGLRLPVATPGAAPAWHLYAVRILGGRRREVYEAMHRAGIGVQVHYLPVHLHPLFADRGYRPGSCPVAEAAYTELLSLPLHPDMDDLDVDRVVDELRRALT